jgi:hypothetical protein
MVGHGDQPPEKTAEEIQREVEEEIARAAHLARDAKKGRGIMAYRMTWGHWRMDPGMVLLQGETTRSLTHGAKLTEIDSETGHSQFVMRSAGSSTRGSRSTALQPKMPWPRGCSSIKSLLAC